ncbi:MAG: N-acetylglucosamine-6-phosphate deacetylase [Brevundimonas subvibrioides]|uniref:N-acetylglucosamine-6-phosphate deacetylase n=1 Tax=Brevundimonas subvibrioides TaxID=74313 RepID=A0A258FIT1_9CAUL|nr:MAG: N-acetylglucosamine-6-phosphate deacetylase [Brevundimonas subvibrioides]
MTVLALTGARILTPDGWLDDHAVVVEQGAIRQVTAVSRLSPGLVRRPLDGGFLIPGFIDVQVNGGGGVLLNDQPTLEGVRAIAAAHRRFGTTALLPTLISDDLAVVAQAIAAVQAAMAEGVPGVVGLHIEGPFLNRGKPGIHDSGKFRALDAAAVDLLSSLNGGVTLVTLAPELVEPSTLRALTERGVVVSAGHTLATYDQMRSAVDAGLTGVTHLFNAMSPFESRHPGVVGAALDLGLTSGLIVDGHHVHPAALRIALAAAGPDHMMLVTDAMPTVGSADKRFTLGGRLIVAEDGACRAEDGTLAGSDLDMALAVRNAIRLMGVDLATASTMASATPARFLGQGHRMGTIEPGRRADLVHLDTALGVAGVWIAGAPA